MTAVGIIWAAALSVISFLAANAYTACLLSLPGNPISNLTAAFSHLPSYLIGHGPLSLEAAALATGLVAACSLSGAPGRGPSPTGPPSAKAKSTDPPAGAPCEAAVDS